MSLYRKRKISDEQMEKEWKVYKKKTKGMEQMDKDHFYRFNYGVRGKGSSDRTTLYRSRLRDAGVDEKKIQKLSR